MAKEYTTNTSNQLINGEMRIKQQHGTTFPLSYWQRLVRLIRPCVSNSVL